MFNSKHPAAFNAVINAKTPRIIALKNLLKGMIIIFKQYPIGRIKELEDSSFLACSWDSAFIALTVAMCHEPTIKEGQVGRTGSSVS